MHDARQHVLLLSGNAANQCVSFDTVTEYLSCTWKRPLGSNVFNLLNLMRVLPAKPNDVFNPLDFLGEWEIGEVLCRRYFTRLSGTVPGVQDSGPHGLGRAGK